MAFQVIVEWVAHGLEAMGIAVVSVGGSAAMINFARRVMAGDAFDENIRPSKRRNGVFKDGQTVSRFRHIAADSRGTTPGCFDVGDRLLGFFSAS